MKSPKRFVERLMDVKPISSLIIELASLNLKVNEVNSATIEDHAKLAFSWHFLRLLTIRPSQIKEEITRLMALIEDLHSKVVLEIGTGTGGTLYLFSKVAVPDAIIISVDFPGGPFGGGYPNWKIPLYTAFAGGQQKIHLITGNSHDALTLLKVRKVMCSHLLDFLFIDGDHSYEGVRKDFEMYAPLVRNGGITAFHDIVFGPLGAVGGVPRFWYEIRHSYDRCIEIVNSWKQGGHGIGVIFL